MRPTEFLYNIIDRWSPMQEQDRTQLRRDASLDYLKIKDTIMDEAGNLKENVTPKTMKLKQKFVYYGEKWYVRTLLALLFIGCLRWIQDWIEPPDNETEDAEFVELP